MRSLEIRNIGCLATPLGRQARRGKEQGEILRLRDAAVRAEGGRLIFVGTEADYARAFSGKPAAKSDRCRGAARSCRGSSTRTRTPCGPGTGGPRSAAASPARATRRSPRKAGASTPPSARRGRLRRGAGEAAVRRRLTAMRAHGTTTAEVEVRLRADRAGRDPRPRPPRRLSEDPSLPRLVPTLLAAHEIPARVRATTARAGSGSSPRRSFRAPPARSSRSSATSSASKASTRWRVPAILEAARREGLGPARPRRRARAFRRRDARCGAQGRLRGPPPLHREGGDRRARRRPARWPSFCPEPPGGCGLAARRRGPSIEAGVPVAIASDANPGTCHTESLPAVAVHACLDSGLSVEEVLTGMTLNAAASLGLADEIGSLEVGKSADLLILEAPDDRHLIYHWGINLVGAVVLRGPRRGRQPDVTELSQISRSRDSSTRSPRTHRRPAAERPPRPRGPWAPRSPGWWRP